MLLLALASACLLGAVYLLVVAPRRAARSSLGRVAAYGRTAAATPSGDERRTFVGVGALAGLGRRLTPRGKRDAVAQSLLAAGLARRVTAEAYLAAKAGLVLAGAALGLAAGARGGAGTGLLLALLLGTAGLLLPDSFLRARARLRREAVLAELPNALDLLAVSVEAGLGLDGAIARYADTAEGPVAEELARVVGELRVGSSRHDVLRRFAERVPAPETAAFVRAVVHADALGASLTRTLRSQAAEARVRRQARAEEIANKAPVKMLFPTVFFVFPALFVVVLGPAVLYLSHAF